MYSLTSLLFSSLLSLLVLSLFLSMTFSLSKIDNPWSWRKWWREREGICGICGSEFVQRFVVIAPHCVTFADLAITEWAKHCALFQNLSHQDILIRVCRKIKQACARIVDRREILVLGNSEEK